MTDFTVNVKGHENSPYPIVFRNLCEHHEQETVKNTVGRSFHQILFIKEGSGMLYYGGKSYALSRGAAFFTKAYKPVEYVNLGGLVSAFLTVIGSAAESLSEALTDDGLLFVKNADIEKYLAMLEGIKREYEANADQGRLSSLVYAFYVDFLSQGENAAPEYLEAAVKYIERNFSSKLTLDGIARHSCVSVSKLCHSFKKAYGKSVFEYIVEVRLRYARNLLLSPGRVMTKEAAISCGFSDIGYFCRAYKKHFGVTPGSDGRGSQSE